MDLDKQSSIIGGEKPETYAYIAVLNDWLRRVGFPQITIVRHEARLDDGLEDNCVRLRVLPSQAFDFSSCSDRWKQAPQSKFVNRWLPARISWRNGQRVVKAIGFEAGECNRVNRANTYRAQHPDKKYDVWFPLVEHGLDLSACVLKVMSAGLPVPAKSSCWFCPRMKPQEISELAEAHPHLLVRGLVMEQLALPKLTVIKGLGGRQFRWRDLAVSQPYLRLVDRVVVELDRGQIQSGASYIQRVDELVYLRLAA